MKLNKATSTIKLDSESSCRQFYQLTRSITTCFSLGSYDKPDNNDRLSVLLLKSNIIHKIGP